MKTGAVRAQKPLTGRKGRREFFKTFCVCKTNYNFMLMAGKFAFFVFFVHVNGQGKFNIILVSFNYFIFARRNLN